MTEVTYLELEKLFRLSQKQLLATKPLWGTKTSIRLQTHQLNSCIWLNFIFRSLFTLLITLFRNALKNNTAVHLLLEVLWGFTKQLLYNSRKASTQNSHHKLWKLKQAKFTFPPFRNSPLFQSKNFNLRLQKKVCSFC